MTPATAALLNTTSPRAHSSAAPLSSADSAATIQSLSCECCGTGGPNGGGSNARWPEVVYTSLRELQRGLRMRGWPEDRLSLGQIHRRPSAPCAAEPFFNHAKPAAFVATNALGLRQRPHRSRLRGSQTSGAAKWFHCRDSEQRTKNPREAVRSRFRPPAPAGSCQTHS